ncbi:MAG TPA: family 78 glycoside hydrolase catalytic domain [Kiritimatiellia bacterium]|nr:family 78 glycoside hydrolase catalytic domain [Kiritimatiellia bacterium]HRU69540.1 family 78 glycoside hydrolase catalytic domain [Kiritimatiellia bacterium]
MNKFLIVCAATAVLTGCASLMTGSNGTKTVGLQTCRLVSPANITKPVFSWKMSSTRHGAQQTAYRIKVGTADGSKLGQVVWDSQTVTSDRSTGIEYGGPVLKSATKYVWEVAVRDEKGAWLKPVQGTFTTGLLDANDWRGSEWIAIPGQEIISSNNVPKNESSVPGTSCFVKELDLGTNIKEAYWTVTGQGVFEAYVNGVRVGDDFLKPGFTHVFKTRHAFTYDVTDLLGKKGGKDVFSAMVSAGWWRDKIVHYRGKESAFRAQLIVRYADGSEKRFGTDRTWLGAIAGPVKRASIFEGEEYDARISMNWTQKGGFDAFKAVKAIDEFKGVIVPMEGSPIRLREDLVMQPTTAYVWQGVEGADEKTKFGKVKIIRSYRPGEKMTLSPGETLVVDFGQNAAAVPRFTATAAAGTTITILPAEMLNDQEGLKSRGNDGPEGSVYRVNLRGIHKEGARAVYTFAGMGAETYLPRFTFFGYRYVSVTATDKVTITKLESVPVTSIPKELELGCITTGEKDVNRLISNVKWGQYSNYLSVPTDCPQRNERLGWTADTQVFTEAASCNADVYGFLYKWMRDMRDSQLDTGSYPSVAPVAQYGNEGDRLGWADAGIIVPYTLWRRFGDASIVKANWTSMKRYLARLAETKHATPPDKRQYADWLSYEKYQPCGAPWGKNPPKEAFEYWNYLGACYWLWDARMMAEMAAMLGEKNDEKFFRDTAEKALAHIRSTYVAEDGLLSKTFRDLQTACLFALKLGLLKDAKAVAETKAILLQNIKDHGDCLQTGFLGTSILMDTLTYDVGAPEVAYTLLLQRKNPSWLYSVDQGATTIWERWNSYVKETGFGPVGMNSFNHYAYGAVLAWMYGTMAGIREDPAAPGFKHFILAPIPDKRVGHVSAEYDSAYGIIRSSWAYDKDGRWTWSFTIPANTTATVTLPGGETKTYVAGSYRITR